ncbi:hypothetical protein GJ496_007578 [Pomphorhynchus laevis]|nr:hypothetical protein GJ496_007578 [Pomphorhynchus laevis]
MIRREPVAFVVYVGSLACACRIGDSAGKRILRSSMKRIQLISGQQDSNQQVTYSNAINSNQYTEDNISEDGVDNRFDCLLVDSEQNNEIIDDDINSSTPDILVVDSNKDGIKSLFILVACATLPFLIYLKRMLNNSPDEEDRNMLFLPIDDRIKLDLLITSISNISLRLIEHSPLMMKYGVDLIKLKDEFNCSICLLDETPTIENSLMRIAKTYCNHKFHVECLSLWLHRHTACPYCRQDLIIDCY